MCLERKQESEDKRRQIINKSGGEEGNEGTANPSVSLAGHTPPAVMFNMINLL